MMPVWSATIAPNTGSGSGAAPLAASARWCRREMVISINRQAPTAPQRQRKKAVELTPSGPPEQHHLGREARTERGQDAVCPRGRPPPGQPLVQHEQDRRARLVAEVAQDRPRRLRVVAPQPQLLFDEGQDLTPPRVQHEAVELLASQAPPPAFAPAARSRS